MYYINLLIGENIGRGGLSKCPSPAEVNLQFFFQSDVWKE